MTDILVLIFGLLFGSFFNVCISRLPQGESVVWPGSRCPRCQASIRWYDNIPVLSYVLLQGQCRKCRKSISLRYPLVEVLTAGMAWVLWRFLGPGPDFIVAIIFCSILLITIFTDFETGLIPDELTYSGIAAGVAAGLLMPGRFGEATWYGGLLKSCWGGLVGAGILELTARLGKVIFRKDAMGGGDVKLLAMIGTFLGATQAVFVFFFAPFFALPVALYVKFVMKKETIPYGPYLAASGILFFFAGQQIQSYFIISY